MANVVHSVFWVSGICDLFGQFETKKIADRFALDQGAGQDNDWAGNVALSAPPSANSASV